MKKKQRLAVILTAAVLALAPCAAGFSVSAEGEESTYNITVNATKAEGSAFSGYQIFKGDFSGGKLNNIKWGSAMTGKAAALLEALQKDDIFKKEGTNVFAGLTAESKAADFADIMGEIDNESAMANELAKVLGKIATEAVTDTNDAANIIGGVSSGYYLVKETTKASQTNPISLNLLRVVGEDAEIDAKEDLPTLEKKITEPNAKDDGKANGVSIGDTVKYEIRTTMPDLTGYEKYYYVINDTMTAGLTFDPESVRIKNVETTEGSEPKEKTLSAGTDFEVQIGTEADGYTFQIVFLNFVKRTEAPGSKFVVTYNAVLNENANRETAGNLNTADLTYSNNPNVDSKDKDNDHPDEPKEPEEGEESVTGKTPQKQTKTYTANIQLTKKDNEGNKLTGAKFRLTGTAAKVVLINGTAFKYSANDSGTYYKLTDGTFTETAPTDATADKYVDSTKYALVETDAKETSYENICMEAYVKSDGTLEFGGLAAGTYTLTELVAPEGFNKLEKPITVVINDDGIKFEKGAEDPDLWTATVDGKDVKMVDTATVAFDVVNKPGNTLPSTGGIGTKLFYLFGGMLAIGSGVLLVTKKRVGKEEQ